MFGQFGSKKNPCNMRFMHYHSMHYDNFYCTALALSESMYWMRWTLESVSELRA